MKDYKIFRPQRNTPAFTAFLYGDLPMGVAMGKMLKTSAQDRKCMFPDCVHTLSIYNHEDYCHIHLDKMPLDKKSRILTHPQKP